MSGITERSLKTAVNSRHVTSLGHQEGRRIFWRRPKFYIASMYENNGYAYNMSKTFFQGRRKFFQRGLSPPLGYGPGHQMIKYAEITC